MFSTLTSIFKSYLGSASDSPESTAAAKTTVESLIAQNDIFVASKSYCPYCTRAKSLLSQLGADSRTKTLELDHDQNGTAIQRYLASRIGAGRVTVPQIYIKGKLIGGNSDLQALHANGDLAKVLA